MIILVSFLFTWLSQKASDRGHASGHPFPVLTPALPHGGTTSPLQPHLSPPGFVLSVVLSLSQEVLSHLSFSESLWQ